MREKFQMILDNTEEVIWCNDINISAYVIRHFLKTFLFGLFPPIALLMLGVPYGWLILILSLLNIIPIKIGVAYFAFSLFVCLIYIIILIKGAKNTYFCITNKRIIKRSGAFTNDYEQYSLKNIGNIKLDGSFFDSKNENPSASLLITVKDYHTDTNGESANTIFSVESLNNVYEAYKLINELTDGNNESFRIKVEK